MKQFLLVFLFSSFFFNTENADYSILDFSELILQADIVLMGLVVDECHMDHANDETFVQFKVKTDIKGDFDGDLFVNSEMLYQGDIPQALKTLESFTVNHDYLLFLQKRSDSYTILNQYTLQQIESDTEDLLVPLNQEIDHANAATYSKSHLLEAIEAFVYNETEILTSEIVADHGSGE